MSKENDIKGELDRRRSVRLRTRSTDDLTDQKFGANLFDSTVLLALCYASDSFVDTAVAKDHPTAC